MAVFALRLWWKRVTIDPLHTLIIVNNITPKKNIRKDFQINWLQVTSLCFGGLFDGVLVESSVLIVFLGFYLILQVKMIDQTCLTSITKTHCLKQKSSFESGTIFKVWTNKCLVCESLEQYHFFFN